MLKFLVVVSIMLSKIKSISKYNFKNMLKFELIFKLLTVVVFSPIFISIFNLIMKVTGYSYLSKENFGSFLLNPITLVMLVILFLLITFYSLFDIGVIIILIDGSHSEKNISLKEAIIYSLKRSLNVFHFKNILLIFMVIFLIPFLNIGIGINLISSIKIPEFIIDYINSNQILLLLYFFLIIILVVIFLNWIYSLHYYFLENCSFKEAIKRSKSLIKNSHLKDLGKLIFTQGILSFIYIIFLVLELVIIVIINKIFKNITIVNSFLITINWLSILISFLIHSILSSTISYTILSVLFYQHKIEKNEKVVTLNFKEKKIHKKKGMVIFNVLAIILLIFLTYFTSYVLDGKFNLNVEYMRKIEVTAHRGASIMYPENTMRSFVGAKELGADWIELDVQQTKDNNIIVLHDTNFKRTAGVNLNTWEASLDDINNLDVGSFKGQEFKGEKVPLLQDVIVWAKDNNMKLNIELKPTGYEKDFEKNVSDIISKYHFEDNSVITSQVYEVLENFKKINRNIKTVYVTALAYGDITRLLSADYFSVEATSITKSMVTNIHNQGKQIYAWTVNTKDNINKMIDYSVDNIITDDPTLVKNLIYSSKTSNVISLIVKFINQLFN